MQIKEIPISPQTVKAISRVLARGETAQVKYIERDGSVKVYGVKMKIEQEERC